MPKKRIIASDSDSDDDKPLVATTNGKQTRSALLNGNGKRPHSSDSIKGEHSDEDVPLAKRVKPATANGTNGKASSSKLASTSSSPSRALKEEDDTSEDEPLASQASETREIISPEKIKDESDSDDDIPLVAATSVNKKDKKPPPKRKSNAKASSDSEAKPTPKRAPRKRVKKEEDSDADVKTPKKTRAPARKRAKVEPVSGNDDDSEDDKPLAKAAPVKTDKKAAKDGKEKDKNAGKKGKGKGKKEEEEEEEEDTFKWWEADMLGDGSQKWQTLEHSGVLFPPPYTPLPKNVKLLYNGTYLTRFSCTNASSR